MHLIVVPELASHGPLQPGSYLCEDANAWEFGLMHQGDRCFTSPFNGEQMGVKSFTGRILVIANLAFGDCILFTPVLQAMKRLFPQLEIHLCVPRDKFQVFLGASYVSAFIEYPPALATVSEYTQVITTEHTVEHNLLARSQHMTDRFAEHFGLVFKDKKPVIDLTEAELEWAKKSFPRTAKRRLGIHVQAGTRSRSYPMSMLFQAQKPEADASPQPPMIKQMIDDGWEIGLLGRPGEFAAHFKVPEITDLSRRELSFRQTLAYMTTCDCILAPDSSLMHGAGALDIPCVALFGPFPWKLRTAYYASVHALTGNGGCPKAPCFHTHHNGLPMFPLDGPCATTGVCTELTAITPERIRAKIEQVSQKPEADSRPPASPPPGHPAE